MGIPKIIHQISLDPQDDSIGLGDDCRRVNSTWEHKLWRLGELPADLRTRGRVDALLESNRVQRYGEAANVLKYELLYRYGGFYVDRYAVFSNPLSDEFAKVESFSCYENEVYPGIITAAYLGASRQNEFMNYLLDRIVASSHERIIKNIGPNFQSSLFLTESLRMSGYRELTIYPEQFFISVYGNEAYRNRASAAYCWIDTRDKQARFATTLLAFKHVMDRQGVRFFLASGTALGVHRERRFIPHDEDIDVGVFCEDYDPRVEALFLSNGFELRIREGDPRTGYEVSFRHRETKVHVDIFIHYREETEAGEKLWYGCGFHPKLRGGCCRYVHTPFTLRPVAFLGTHFELPSPVEGYLIEAYGEDWRVPKRFNFSDGLKSGEYKNLAHDPNMDDYLALRKQLGKM